MEKKNFKRRKERILKEEVEDLVSNYKLVTGELNPQAPGKRNRKRRRASRISSSKKPKPNKSQENTAEKKEEVVNQVKSEQSSNTAQ